MTAQLVLSVALQLALLRPPLFGRALEGQHRTAPAPVALAGRRRTAEGLGTRRCAKPPASADRRRERARRRPGFHLPHRALLSATSCWTAAHNLTGRVVLVVDHGDEECAFLLPSGVAVAFAGPHQKADDAITRDVAYFSSALHRDSSSSPPTPRCAAAAASGARARGGCTS